MPAGNHNENESLLYSSILEIWYIIVVLKIIGYFVLKSKIGLKKLLYLYTVRPRFCLIVKNNFF